MNDETRAKIWIMGIVSGLTVFIIVNFLVWLYGINSLFLPYPHCGDLARIGYAPELSRCREERLTQPKRVHPWTREETKDSVLLSFGDSISRGRGGGVDNYWQDHLATHLNLDIAWLSELTDNNYLHDIVVLRNSGFLKKYKVQYLIVQSVERLAVERLTREVDWRATMNLPDLEAQLERQRGALLTDYRYIDAWEKQKRAHFTDGSSLRLKKMIVQFALMHGVNVFLWFDRLEKKVAEWEFTSRTYNAFLKMLDLPPGTLFYKPVLNLAKIMDEDKNRDAARNQMAAALNHNYNWLLQTIINKLGLHQYQGAAQRYKLIRPMFNGRHGDELLFHLAEYKSNIKNSREGRIELMHDNLNKLARLLKEDGVTLYFMPSPNKLTAYENYLTEPLDAKSVFFERLRALTNREYQFIDTEQVIRRMVEAGEKDVYFIDDTHWSNKALPEIVKLFDLPVLPAAH